MKTRGAHDDSAGRRENVGRSIAILISVLTIWFVRLETAAFVVERCNASKQTEKTISAKGTYTLTTIQSVGQGILAGGVSFCIFFMYVSFFEWALHKYIMHTPIFVYPFQAHALTHHGLFRADHSYYLRREQDVPKVTFAWWNAPGLFILNMPLLFLASTVGGVATFIGGSTALLLNYMLYEYLHWCMHIPQGRWIERTRAFQFLKKHHYLHHRYALRNLNVVLPLADWVMGTLITASDTENFFPLISPQPRVEQPETEESPEIGLIAQEMQV